MVVQNIEVGKGTLAVEINGSGPLVICAPAMGDLRNAYDPLASQLTANGFTVAVMDNRGHGDSSTSFTKYGDEATANDFITLIEKLNKGPAILAGASFSAGSATIAAGRRPDLVRGVILLGPFLRNGMGSLGPYIARAIVMRPWGTMAWKMYSKTLWPGLGEEGAAKRAEETMASLTRPGRWNAFQATVKGADHSVVEPYLSKVKDIPALVVMGEKDPDFGKPSEEARWIASNFGEARVVDVPGCGHAPHFENPELVGREVLGFLRGLEGKAST